MSDNTISSRMRKRRAVNKTNRRKWAPNGKGMALWARQNGRCFYCERKMVRQNSGISLTTELTATFDHIVTRSNNGSDEIDNLVLACEECNRLRGDAPADEFLLTRHPKSQAAPRACSSTLPSLTNQNPVGD